jgi:hypothetical protein
MGLPSLPSPTRRPRRLHHSAAWICRGELLVMIDVQAAPGDEALFARLRRRPATQQEACLTSGEPWGTAGAGGPRGRVRTQRPRPPSNVGFG